MLPTGPNNQASVPPQASSVEKDLVDKARGGDIQAFGHLAQRHYGRVYVIAYARLGMSAAAEDLTQEVFLRAFLHLNQFDSSRLFSHWISRITHNLACNWQKGQQTQSKLIQMLSQDGVQRNAPAPRPHPTRAKLERAEWKLIVHQAIFQLPAYLREIILLRFIEELSNREIAEILGLQSSTVGRHLEKAIASMRLNLVPFLPECAAQFYAPNGARPRMLALIANAATLSPASRNALASASSISILEGTAEAPPASTLERFLASHGDSFQVVIDWMARPFTLGKGLIAFAALLSLIEGCYVITKKTSPVGATVRICELFEEPRDATADCNDDGNGDSRFYADKAPSGLDHPTHDLAGKVAFAIDTFHGGNAGSETPIQSLSGLRWGGYCAARATTAAQGNTHDLVISNPEPLGIGDKGCQSFIDFVAHNTIAASDFPTPYNEQTGSYVYTPFADNPHLPAMVDGQGPAKFRVGWDYLSGHPTFRFLIQTDCGRWFRSTADLPMVSMKALNGEKPWTRQDMRPSEKIELMQSFELAKLSWERISAPAEANMNKLDNGGEVPLGRWQAGRPSLDRITGMGVIVSSLAEGAILQGAPSSIHLMGLVLEGKRITKS